MINDLWYKNVVVYSLDVETFMDSNGDGVGDLRGLMERLDYLEALGIDVIWLNPFQPSPNRDDGYDISDYYGVDPRYGSSGDFVELMHDAHARGIRIISDLVVNHTSDAHRWFRLAREGPGAPYHDWFIWSRKRPKKWDEGMVFPGVQKSTWSRDESSGEWYYHRFYDFQPDLNMENPEVRAEVRRIMGYWLQVGVSGFRVDALPFIIEGNEDDPAERSMHFEYLAEMREFLQWRAGDAILLGEANVLPKDMKPYFGTAGDGIHMMFNFFVNQHLFYALATAEVEPLVAALRATRGIPAVAQWGQFLRNHDELDLGRLTDEQRQAVFEKFAPEKHMQLYDRGIRRRLAPMIGNRPQVELANSLMFSLPGTPVLRYGEEIGMGDELSLPERYPVRTPMQWSGDENAGFSTARKLVRPLVEDGVWSYRRVNVAAQQRDPDSLLRWFTRMIRLRKEVPEIGWGDWKILDTHTPGTLAMRYEWRGNSVVILHNFNSAPCEVRLRVDGPGGDRLVDLLVDQEVISPEGKHRIALDAYGYRWFRVGSLNYALTRRDV